MKPTFKQRLLFGSISLALTAPSTVAAVLYYDNASGGNSHGTAGGTWDVSTNQIWTASTTGNTLRLANYVTTTSDDLNFGNNVSTGLGAGTILVTTPSAGTLTFGSASGAIVLSGGTITLKAAGTITVNNPSDTISSSLAGAATSLTKAGTGTLVLSGASVYTGATTISAGTLTLSNSLALQNTALNTTASVAGAAAAGLKTTATTLTLGGLTGDKNFAATGGVFTTTSGGYAGVTALTLNPGTGVTNSYSGAIANGASGMTLTKSGLGTQVFTGQNTFTGNITVGNGTLAAAVAGTGGNSAFGSAVNTRTINVNTGGVLRFDIANVFTNNFASSSVPSLSIGGGTVNNNVAGNNALGNVTLSGGTLTAANGSATYGAFNINGNITSSGTSLISTSNSVNGKMMLTSSGANNVPTSNTVNVTSGTLTISAPLAEVTLESKISGLTKTGPGTLLLSGANAYTGATLVSEGLLQLNGSAAGTPTTSGLTVGSGAALGFTAGTASSLNLAGKAMSLGGSVAFDIGASGSNDSITVNDFTLTGNSSFSFSIVGSISSGATYTLLASTNAITNSGPFSIAGQSIGKLTLTPTINTNSITVTASLLEGIWNQAGGGNWSLGNSGGPSAPNWDNYKPTVAGDAALFGSAIAAPATVVVDAPHSLGYLRFDNANAYTIGTGTSNLTIDNGASFASIVVTSGSHTIAENVILASNASVSPASGTTLTVSGGLSGTGLGLQLSDSGTLVLSGANTYSGATTINSGTLNLSGSGALGTGAALTLGGGKLDLGTTSQTVGAVALTAPAASGNTIGNGSLAGTSYSVSNASGNAVISAGLGGTGALTKSGAGTATLTGANTYSGATAVSGGTLVAAGGSTTIAALTVGNAAGNSVLNVPTGGTMTGGTSVTVGTVSGAVGAVNLSGGTLTTIGDSDSSAFGAADGGYGAFTMTAGSVFTQPRFMFGGIGSTTTGGAVGVGLITGGTVNASNWFILSRTVASTGILTVTGGQINHNGAGNNLVLGLAGTGRAELNMNGGVIDNSGRTLNMGGSGTFHWAGTGVLNLNGGTVQTNSVVYDANVVSVTSNSYVNFSGGTLKAATASASFLPAFVSAGSGINRVFINGAFSTFAGGATIDTNGFNNTVSANLLAPTGNGVTSLSLDSQGSGYIGAPAVKILDDGLPSTATAYAVVDTDSSSANFGKVTNVFITNPGVIVGTPTVSLVGGGGSGAAVSVATTGANTSGGLTKIGTGTLTLSGVNTYTGATSVTTGTLKSSTAGSAITDITVAAGGAASTGVLLATNGGQWINAGDLTLNSSSSVFIDYSSTTPSISVAPISVENLIVGSNLGVKIEGPSLSSLAPSTSYPLLTWSGSGPADASAFTTIINGHLVGTFIVSSNTLFLNVTSNAAGLPISWNTGDGTWDTASTNWLDGTSVATTYFDTQDAVTFGDAAGVVGNPTVTLNSAFTPTGVTMNSTSHDYTITGSGGISGTTGLTLDVAHTRTLTLATVNSYTGATTINNGTLKLSGSGTLGGAGSTVAISSAGLLDLNGTNQAITFAAGTGVGTVTNNSGSGTSILTISGTPTILGNLVTIQDNTNATNGKVAVVITGNTNGLSNTNTYSGGTTVNAGAFFYHTSAAPLGAGTGPINLTALGANGATSSGLVVDGTSYANDIAGAGYVHNNSNAGTSTTVFTGNLNTSGPFIFRGTTGTIYNFAGTGTTSTLSGVIGSTTSMVNGAVASGSIIKSGTGTLTLSGANIYSGSTTVTGGILNLSGNRTATAGNVTVGNLNGSTGTLNVSNGTFNTGTFALGGGDGTALGVVNQSGGTLTLTSTQLIIGNGGAALASAGNGGNGTYNLSGGTLTATSVGSRGVILGTNDGGTSTFNLSGTGNLLLTGALSQLMVGRADSAVVNTTNVFNQTGGSASVSILSIGGAAAGATGLNSTFTVTGGTFTAASFPSLGVGGSGIVTMNIGGTADVTLPAFPTARGASTTATISFNGGTLRPLAASAAYMSGLTAANIKAGGARFNTTNGSITIAQSLLADSTVGGLTKDGTNSLILAGANSYTGNTVVNSGELALADNAQLKFVIGATSGTTNSVGGMGTLTVDGDFNIDTTLTDATALTTGSWTLVDTTTLSEVFNPTFTIVGGGWSETANVWTKTVGAKKYTFTEATGTLVLSPAASYASWIDSFFPGETLAAIIGAASDPDNDGIENGVEMVIGGNPATGMDTALLPTIEMVNADPDGDTTFSDYLLFTYRRSDLSVTAGVTADCETSTNLVAPWTAATGAPGVVIRVDNNFVFTPPAAADTDRVRVYVPGGANTKLFGRLDVVTP